MTRSVLLFTTRVVTGQYLFATVGGNAFGIALTATGRRTITTGNFTTTIGGSTTAKS
jgi:hypothetical protein